MLLEEDRSRAFDDAGLQPDEVLLHVGPPGQWLRGKAWPLGEGAWLQQQALGEEDYGRFDSPEGRLQWRVGVWFEGRREEHAAVLRHELEHIRQFKTHEEADLPALHRRASDLLSRLINGGSFYNSIPMEVDANTAAAAFARQVFGDARIDDLVAQGADKHLLLRPGRPPDGSLVQRMQAFIDHGAQALVEAERAATD